MGQADRDYSSEMRGFAMNKYKILKTAFTNLRIAVIEKAIADYKEALKQKRKRKAWEIESFFLSEEGQAFTRGNGKSIIERIRKEVGIDDAW